MLRFLRKHRLKLSVLLTGYIILWMLGGCADQFILFPSKAPIDAPGAQRRQLDFQSGKLEVLTARSSGAVAVEPEAYVLRFCGNAERAEWSAARFSADWGEKPLEMWSVNHPGYGNSSGKASLSRLGPAALAAYDAIAVEAKGKPIYVSATSLGTTMAMHVAARRPVAGMIIRTPPPLRQLIVQRHGWWNLWLLATPVAMGVPSDIDSVANAKKASAPAVFILIETDEVIPLKYQQMVVNAYAGPKQVIISRGGDHNSAITREATTELNGHLQWLWGQRNSASAGR
jgi:hypothetical protein